MSNALRRMRRDMRAAVGLPRKVPKARKAAPPTKPRPFNVTYHKLSDPIKDKQQAPRVSFFKRTLRKVKGWLGRRTHV